MIQKFQEAGYDIVNFDEEADIYVVNTCTVTNMSDRKSRQILRRAKELNEKAIVVAVGCYVQVAKNEIDKIPEIDFTLGTNEKVNIVNNVESFLENGQKINIDDVLHNKNYGDFGDITYTEKTRAVIKVQDGCDRFCSYCIIPYARGRVRSRKPENVIKEIEDISKKGIKEVVITGIHVASYGKDFNNQYRLIDLLEEINKIDGIVRIRLGSLEPKIITEEFMQRLIKLEKICHHFHLSLQSGCDNTLKRMNRKYTTSEFEEIVQRLRKYYNDVILTTDIIVGFPGETEEDFETTYNYLKKINFYKMHVFPYSPRKGTVAAKMPNQIQGDVKERRSKRLIELSNENQKQYNQNLIGKDVDVLFEEKNKEGYYKGHTQNYLLVEYKTNKELENQIVKVNIKKAELEYVIG